MYNLWEDYLLHFFNFSYVYKVGVYSLVCIILTSSFKETCEDFQKPLNLFSLFLGHNDH